MTWNYRVMQHDHETPIIGDDGKPVIETSFDIHEVYYSTDGNPVSYTSDPIAVSGESIDGLGWVLDRMREAVAKPVLTEADFPGPSRPT